MQKRKEKGVENERRTLVYRVVVAGWFHERRLMSPRRLEEERERVCVKGKRG